ncbi:MAG: IscS subfamily cysteine desulfurase [Pseudomonadales bacterium]|nr:IscS subfamily cysteine desulfurase [Pseudomonadales bacterium]
MTDPVYLDYAATTPTDPRVAHQMGACLTVHGNFGNPASRSHAFGWQAEEAVELARAQMAKALHADVREIIWTSGATESDNLALKGPALAPGQTKRHIVTTAIEHKAVLDTCAYLETQGFEVTYLDPDKHGRVEASSVAEVLREDTLIVSVMHVNNELGTINDVAAIGQVCRDKNVLFHVDAAQSFGKLEINVATMCIDMLSISAHKIYGPKGIGCLYVRREPPIKMTPLIHGGGHEMGLRSGTLATHQIVGLGAAAELMIAHMHEEQVRLSALRQRFLRHIHQIPGFVENSHPEHNLHAIVNLGFSGVDGETLLLALDDLAISSGSACTSASVEPSYVLRAIGVPEDLAHASLRFSFGRFTTEEEVDRAGRRVAEVVGRLRTP